MIDNIKNALIKMSYSKEKKSYAGYQLYPAEKEALFTLGISILFIPIVALLIILIN